MFFARQTRRAELRHRLVIKDRRHAQVINAIRRLVVFDFVEQFGELGKVTRAVHIARRVVDALGKFLERRRVKFLGLELRRRFGELVAPFFVREFGARDPDNPRVGGEAILAIQTVKRGDQFAASEIARGAEDDKSLGHKHCGTRPLSRA